MNAKPSIVGLGVLMALAVAIGGAATVSAPPSVAATVVRQDAMPAATVEFPDGVLATPDVEYANFVGFRPLLLDLYRESGPVAGRRRPLVIYVHGGGWQRGDSRTLGAFADFPAVLASLAARGYVVAAVNYRLSGEARFPAAVRDLNAAIEFLRAHAGEYGIDPTRVVLWGASAGSQLATLSAASCGDSRFAPPASAGRLSRRQAAAVTAPRISDCAEAVVAWYGVYDLAPLADGVGDTPALAANVRTFLGCGNASCARLLREASPITYISPKTPPMLLIDGTADTEVPDTQTQEMAAALRRAHVPLEVHFIDAANHGLIEHTAAGTQRASVEALRSTFRFIDKVTASESLASASGADASSQAPRLRDGYPVPPVECSVYVGYDRDRVLPGYRLPSRSGRLMCVPFTTTAAHPPPGYKGDYYVDEFSDAKLRARWQACRAQPGCFKRVEAHIQARLPPNRDRRIRDAHARYLLGMVNQDDNHLDLEKIRRPAFFGSAPWNEDIAKADGRTFTVEFTAPRGPYARYIMHLKGTIRLRGWYLRGSGVPDGHGHMTRALIIMSNGGGGHLVAIEAPNDQLYHVDPKTGKSVLNPFPNAVTGASGQRVWRELLYRLNEAGFDVLSYDRRGIGISGGYCDTDTLQQGRDLLNVVAALRTGSGMGVLTPSGRVLTGKKAADALLDGADPKTLPVFFGGSSRGTMAVGWAMTRNFYRTCNYDMPTVSCGPPRGLHNVRGAVLVSDFSAGVGYLTTPTSQVDRDRALYTAGTEVQYHIVFFPSSAVLAGIHTWPAILIARGAWDYAESLEGAVDAYRRVNGPKDLVIVRGPHPIETWPAAERARVTARIIAFARAAVAGERSVPHAPTWTNMKELVATAPDDGWRSPHQRVTH